MPSSASLLLRASVLTFLATFVAVPTFPAASALPLATISAVTPEAFTLKIGAYGSFAQASRVAARIEGAWVEMAAVNNAQVYRVRVGRFKSHSEAETSAAELRKLGFEPAIRTVKVRGL